MSRREVANLAIAGLAAVGALVARCGSQRTGASPAATPPPSTPARASSGAAGSTVASGPAPGANADPIRASEPQPPAWLAGQTRPGSISIPPPAVPEAAAGWTHGDARARVAAVVAAYRAWGRVDDELRWAPWLCRMPRPSLPTFSAAGDGTPHAQKLYFLYARDRDAYVGADPVPDTQVVVKESWTPHAIAVERATQINTVQLVATRDGQTFEPERFAGLFVMLRVPRGTPDSEARWIYGTSDADGVVTSAGRVASCIGCHEQAGADRLFGLRAARAAR